MNLVCGYCCHAQVVSTNIVRFTMMMDDDGDDDEDDDDDDDDG